MPPRFIDRFEVILLDMVRTFMFAADRFSAADDFAATYRQIGGRALNGAQVQRMISSVFATMLADSRAPLGYAQFSPVLSYLEALPLSRVLPKSELVLLEQVFALHEIGVIPDTHSEVLRQLHQTHRLGVVSDIWSKSDRYLQEFERAGIRQLFEVMVFSSDHGCLKPSPYLFHKASEIIAGDLTKIVFVGDSLRRDIAGAQAVGLSTVWLNANGDTVAGHRPRPDLVIQDLRELLE
ncbi:MAG: HAD family hydrolase [Deltaproteobacteria bacterium]|nr:HAD family hydrolase [Deltaproteobacteria bacterium]